MNETEKALEIHNLACIWSIWITNLSI